MVESSGVHPSCSLKGLVVIVLSKAACHAHANHCNHTYLAGWSPTTDPGKYGVAAEPQMVWKVHAGAGDGRNMRENDSRDHAPNLARIGKLEAGCDAGSSRQLLCGQHHMVPVWLHLRIGWLLELKSGSYARHTPAPARQQA